MFPWLVTLSTRLLVARFLVTSSKLYISQHSFWVPSLAALPGLPNLEKKVPFQAFWAEQGRLCHAPRWSALWACFCRLHRLTCWIQEDTCDSSSSGRQAGLWHPLKVKVPHLKFTQNPQCLQQRPSGSSGKWYKIVTFMTTLGLQQVPAHRNLIIVLNN